MEFDTEEEMKRIKIKDHNELFQEKEYLEQFEKKKEFENPWPAEKVREVAEWTKTEEYQEKNFARKNIKINPVKACQPLGAIFCASGYHAFCSGCAGLCCLLQESSEQAF